MTQDSAQTTSAAAPFDTSVRSGEHVVFGGSASLIQALEQHRGFSHAPLSEVSCAAGADHAMIILDGAWPVERLLAEALGSVRLVWPRSDYRLAALTLVIENAEAQSAALNAMVRSLAREAGGVTTPFRVNLVEAPQGVRSARLVDALAFLGSPDAAFITGARLLLDAQDADAKPRSDAPVLITGASEGIGAACARRLAADGFEVLVTGRDLELCERVAQDILSSGGIATAVALDATQSADWQLTIDRFGVLSGVVSNVGACRLGATRHLEQQDIELMLAANVSAHAHALRIAMPAIKPGGRMVFTGSVAAIKAAPGNAAYSASKAAILDLIVDAAKPARARGIHLHAIHPGLVFNDNVRRTQGEEAAARLRDHVVGGTPLARFAQASDIASAMAALLAGKLAIDPACPLVCDGGFAA